MRLVRYERDGRIGVGRLSDDQVVPMTLPEVVDADALIVRLAIDPSGAVDDAPVPRAEVRLLAPVGRPGAVRDFLAFEEHLDNALKRRGQEIPDLWYRLPVFYFTNPHALYGPDDEVPAPAASQALDFELEVAAVIGRDVRNASPDEAADAIVGWTVFNDFSARDVQMEEMQLTLGPAKGKDFANAFGPCLVTPDELGGDVRRPDAAMTARVNGREYSSGRLAAMHHDWGTIVAHAARDTWVRAGDLIGSGTVGTGCILELQTLHGESEYPWLQPGDEVELEVEGIGVLRNRIGEPG